LDGEIEMNMKGKAAIAGLGITEMGKVFGRTATDFAIEAVDLALNDAGLNKEDIDGLLINTGLAGGMSLDLAVSLGLNDLKLLNHMNAYGSTAGAMIQYAAMCCATGMTKAVVCVFADNPISENKSTGSAYAELNQLSGLAALNPASGIFGVNPFYAMAARRHMELYGTTSKQFGEIAVAQRDWAVMNPRAQMKKAITIDEHQTSRMISDPFHLYDCCLISNGGVAVIVTSSEYAKDLKQPPVYIWGWGQGHPGARTDKLVSTGGIVSSQSAYKMAGIKADDVELCELYDCYTYTLLVTLEDYGFCPKGEGGAFVEDGKIGPNGSFPVNTGGGQLSSYYMWGMTPVSEAIIQARGQAGARQVSKKDVIAVSGNGGILDYHSTLILSPLKASL